MVAVRLASERLPEVWLVLKLLLLRLLAWLGRVRAGVGAGVGAEVRVRVRVRSGVRSGVRVRVSVLKLLALVSDPGAGLLPAALTRLMPGKGEGQGYCEG